MLSVVFELAIGFSLCWFLWCRQEESASWQCLAFEYLECAISVFRFLALGNRFKVV